MNVNNNPGTAARSALTTGLQPPVPNPQPSAPSLHSQFSELSILLGAFLLLVVAALISLALQLGAPDGPPLGARAYGVTGSVALVRWVQALGYETRIVEGRPYRLPDDMRLLFLLQPNAVYTLSDGEKEEVLRWVHAGGTLALAVEEHVSYPITRRGPPQDADGDSSLLEAFGLHLSSDIASSGDLMTVTMRQPLSPQPQVGKFAVRTLDALKTPEDAQVVASAGKSAVIASRQVGNGRVIAFSTTYPFTNDGLRDDGNARLVLSLLHVAPEASVVGFDEYHHGSRQTPSILTWLLTAPAGQGTALALALLMVYIVWTGRRFGRVFVPPELRIRRQPSEYVVAMANLARAAGQYHATLLRYRAWLKQGLGKPYRIDPVLDDEAFVAELSHVNPSVDGQRLVKLLQALNRGTRSNAEFVRLAREASEWSTSG